MPAPVLAELGALRAELETRRATAPVATAPVAPAAEAEPPVSSPGLDIDLEKVLADLRALLGDVGESAEGAIAQNPVAAVSAAFVLGFAAGRLTGQRTSR